MKTTDRFNVLSQIFRPIFRAKVWIPLFIFFALAAVAASFRLMLHVGRAVDLLCAAEENAVKESCLRMVLAASCVAGAGWIAAVCKGRIARDAAEGLYRQVSPSQQRPAFSDKTGKRIDQLAEGLSSALASLLFCAVSAAGAFAHMLRFSVGASIVVILLAPILPLVEARITRRPHPPQSDWWKRLELSFRESAFSETTDAAFRRKTDLLRSFEDVNDRLRTRGQHGIFVTSLRMPITGFVRRTILAAAATSAALGASLYTARIGGFLCFLICAGTCLMVCCTVPEALRTYRSACAEAARFFTFSDERDESAT